MAKQIINTNYPNDLINVGTAANKGDGDVLRTAFTKINDALDRVDANFSELYTNTGDDVQIPSQATHAGKFLRTDGSALSWVAITTPTVSSLVNGSQTVSLASTGMLTLPSSSYLESTDTNLKVGAQGTVTIRSNAASNITAKAWTFGTDGSLTLPGTGTITNPSEVSELTGTIYTFNSDYASSTPTLSSATYIDLALGGNADNVEADWVITFANGLVKTVTSRVLTSTPDRQRISWVGPLTIFLIADVWPLTIQSADYSEGTETLALELTPDGTTTWAFDADGGLTFPDATVQTTAWTSSVSSLVNGSKTVSLDGSLGNLTFTNGEEIRTNFLGGGIELYQSSDNTIGIYSGGAEIKTFATGGAKHTWEFGTDGSLTFPDDLTIDAGVIGKSSTETITEEVPGGTISETTEIESQIEIETTGIVIAKRTRIIADDTVTTSTDEAGSTLTVNDSAASIKHYVEPEGPNNSMYFQVNTSNAGATLEGVVETLNGTDYGRVVATQNAVTVNTSSEGVAKYWLFDYLGGLTLPTPTSQVFTLTFDASHYTPTIGKPSLTLTDDPWEIEGQIQYEQNGNASLQLTNIWPILINPGYDSGDTFTFSTLVHGLSDYTLTIVLNDVVLPGGAGWTANLAASQLPAYPSSILANGAIKLTADTESWVFGGDGNLHFPDGSFQGTAFVGLAATAQDLYKDGEIFIGIGNGLTTTQQWTFGTDGILTFPGATGFQATFGSVSPAGDVLHSVNNLHLESEQSVNLSSGTEVADLETIYNDFVDQLNNAFAGASWTGAGYPAGPTSSQALNMAKALNPLIPDAWITLASQLQTAYDNWQSELSQSEVNISVAGSNVWTFGADGTLTLPQYGWIQGVASNARVELNAVGSNESNLSLATYVTGEMLTSAIDITPASGISLNSVRSVGIHAGWDSATLKYDTWQGAEAVWTEIRNQDAQIIAPDTRPWDGMPSYEAYIVLANYNHEGPGLPPASNLAPAAGDAKAAYELWQAEQAAINVNITAKDQTWTFGNNGQLTVPGQIRKDGGLYLNSGGTGVSSTVFVNGTAGSVILRTDNGTTLKSLTLDVDGVLTLPNNTTISNDLAGEYSDTFLCLTWGYAGGEAGLFSSNNITRPFSNPSVANVTVGWYVSGPLLNGVKQITDIVEQGNGDRAFIVDLTDGSAWADINITIPYRFYTPDYALVYNGTRLTVDSNEWNFTQAGDLTIPGNINEKAGNGLEISVHNNRNNDGTPGSALLSLTNNDAVNGEKLTQLDVGAYSIELSTDYTGVFTGARHTWEFDRDGKLTVPGDIVGYQTFFNGNPIDERVTIQPSGSVDKPFLFTTDQTNGTWQRSSLELPMAENNKAVTLGFPHSNITTAYIYNQGTDTSSGTEFNNAFNIMANGTDVKISTVSGGGNKVWKFAQDGDITLPASGDIVDSTGVGQLANRVEGSWTVAVGSNTVSFTVPANGTYTMWVRGAIDNGVIMWNATATLITTNLPAVGQQFAYAYSGAGTLLDFTTLPTQFIGTAGTVVRSPATLGVPSNVFEFVINNASTGDATVLYGWTKI